VKPLSPREREVLGHMIATGSQSETAAALGISPSSVSTHVTRATQKLGCKNRMQLAARAVRLGLVTAPNMEDDDNS
jgi:DNA-binding CsgD family transcriptional regulator